MTTPVYLDTGLLVARSFRFDPQNEFIVQARKMYRGSFFSPRVCFDEARAVVRQRSEERVGVIAAMLKPGWPSAERELLGQVSGIQNRVRLAREDALAWLTNPTDGFEAITTDFREYEERCSELIERLGLKPLDAIIAASVIAHRNQAGKRQKSLLLTLDSDFEVTGVTAYLEKHSNVEVYGIRRLNEVLTIL